MLIDVNSYSENNREKFPAGRIFGESLTFTKVGTGFKEIKKELL